MARSDSRTLPPNPSLESLKKQAKSLLRAWRRDEPEARERVVVGHPRPERFSGLRDAQLVLAREYGHASWDALTVAVEAANLGAAPRAERIDAFLDDACLDYAQDSPRRRERAQRLLGAEPSLARESVHTAAAAADVEALREQVAADPAQASRAGGLRRWPPLLYLTYARLPAPVGDAVEAARVLLDAGADANAHVRLFERYRFSALTGAMGEGEGGVVNQPPHTQARALAELLLERGADANDAQGLYNTHFTPGNEWIELLVTHGLSADAPADWLDEDRAMGTLDFLLGVAVTWGFTERVELLLRHGADPNGRDAYDDRLHYENALLYGHPEIAKILLGAGAERVELSRASRLRAACMAEDAGQARSLLADDATLLDDERLVHDAIRHGSDGAVRLVFELGASLEAKGQHYSETPLHQAAIQGREALVEQLLALGASLECRDPSFDGTPIGWANQGGHEALRDRLLDHSEDVFDLACWGRGDRLRDVLAGDASQARRTRAGGATALHGVSVAGEAGAQVIELLLAAGAEIDAKTDQGATPLDAALERGDDDVAELLREHGARPPV